MRYALIDESGRLYDPNDRILVFSTIVVDSLNPLEKIIIRARERMPTKGKRRKERLSEIKFSLTGDNTRLFVLKELVKKNVKIYNLIIDKAGRKIRDDPINYAFLIGQALKTPLSHHSQLTHVLIDRHFTFVTQREACNVQIQQKFGNNLFVEHVDSLQNPVITLADFVAGAVRMAYTKHDIRFTQCIENAIKEERTIVWKEIKKR